MNVTHRNDVDVYPRDMMDQEIAKLFEKPWIVEHDEFVHVFDTEEEACAFQREWRVKHRLDAMTGLLVDPES